MPFYEYECQACKFYTEVMQKITDAPLTKCPSCGKRRLQKLVSAPVFRLKGGGWYETDFKSDKENKRNLVGADKEEAKPEASPTGQARQGHASPRPSRTRTRSRRRPRAPAAEPARSTRRASARGQGRTCGAQAGALRPRPERASRPPLVS